MALSPTLTDLSPADLRRRRSAKWTRYLPDVLPAWVAEMDSPLAPPVTRVLQDAIDAGDCGWLDFRRLDLGPDPSQPILERGRLALSPGPQGAGLTRLSFGTSPALVEAAVERIAKAAGRSQPSPVPPSSASE